MDSTRNGDIDTLTGLIKLRLEATVVKEDPSSDGVVTPVPPPVLLGADRVERDTLLEGVASTLVGDVDACWIGLAISSRLIILAFPSVWSSQCRHQFLFVVVFRQLGEAAVHLKKRNDIVTLQRTKKSNEVSS